MFDDKEFYGRSNKSQFIDFMGLWSVDGTINGKTKQEGIVVIYYFGPLVEWPWFGYYGPLIWSNQVHIYVELYLNSGGVFSRIWR